MSANNQLTDQSKETLASHFALHVALQTMKERCMALQERLTSVEEENLSLRLKYGTDKPQAIERNRSNDSENSMEQSEVDILREKVGELTRQKFQLTEHIAMVASENRQLWSRLSKLTKDNQSLGVSLSKIKDTLSASAVPGHQNLIRSKTFTQSSPNPMLRQKILNDNQDRNDDLSLEEIELKEDTERPNENEVTPTKTNAVNSLGFGFLNDESMNTALQNDTKRCLDRMVDIKKELLRQQSDLKVTLSGLRQRKVMEVCLNCKNKPKKVVTADKSFGTSDDEMPSPKYQRNASTCDDKTFSPIQPDLCNERVDILQQKRIADSMDKMCPMCGEIYSSSSSFESFQDHVESHFIDDSELDMSVEKNFEFISSTVGNF